jgi:hypothetical protein
MAIFNSFFYDQRVSQGGKKRARPQGTQRNQWNPALIFVCLGCFGINVVVPGVVPSDVRWF